MRASLVIRCVVTAAITVGVQAWATGAALDAPEVEALRLCHDADAVEGEVREAMLARSLDLATYAARLTPDRADAHFALFCALGKQLDDRGVGWGSLGAIRRLRRTIDRTLALEPDHVDALVGKASMLLRLPRILGGDRDEALRCLERAHRVRPEHPVGASLWRQIASPIADAPR